MGDDPVFSHRTILFFILSASISLFMSACGSRATGGATAEMAGTDATAVDTPAIVIDYNTQGHPSMGGIPVENLAGLLGINAEAVAQLHLDPAFVTQLTKANIQHAQLDNSTDGLLMLVNGQPIPTLVWDESSLTAVAQVMDTFGFGIEQLDTVLPLIRTVGIGTILRFPVAADAELMPMVVSGDESVAASYHTAQADFVEKVGEPAQVQIIVNYAEDGSWTVAGLDATQWSQVMPLPWEDLNLTSAMVAQLSERNVESIQFNTNSDGFFVSVNEQSLPYIGWNQGELQHLLNLVTQPDMLAYFSGTESDGPPAIISLIQQWLPIVQSADTRLIVRFP